MKSMRFALLGEAILVVLLSASCAPATGQAQLANPAAVYCRELGYTSEIRTDAEGGQYDVCVFPDGSECDAWALYRSECGPAGGVGATAQIPDVSPTEKPGINVAALAGLNDTVQAV